MSMPQEHDYIGLSETSPPMEIVSEKLSSPSSSSSSSSTLSTEENKTSLNLRETELRLGLPGSQSPERKPAMSVTPSKNFVSGAKRGFSDAIDGSSAKWGFSVNIGSDVDLSKGAVLFSPRPENGNTQTVTAMKEAAAAAASGVISQSPKPVQEKKNNQPSGAPAAKAQVVGWPPIRSFRKNSMASNSAKNNEEAEGKSGVGCVYVKVSMDGAPYLRKVDLKTYSNYVELSSALEKMFTCFTIGQCSSHGLPGRDGLSNSRLKDLLQGSEYVLTYEDKDDDWMLVGDVPWEMFTETCRRMRIMKGSEAIGLAPRAMEKCKSRN
ncbi:auxin-responsive protein IAA27 [Euphorbia lathyris]|uniref:auxin-responsive protein IAA27 n=1 Tax=Euphorbia lathyris TaxID=212925 RepID=UPI0033132417